MDNLYFEIQINEKTNNRKEELKFFIEKDEKFGLRIEKCENGEQRDKYEFKNISDKAERITDIVKFIISKSFDLSQIEYFIDDYLIKEKALA